MEGYFKVHRRIIDSQVFAHPLALKIWIWCLSRVSYKERFVPVKVGKGETTVKIQPGQFIFGRFKAEEELNIDGSTIYKWMQKFASPDFDMILIESNNHWSKVTLCNWEEYNPLNNKEVTAKEQPNNSQVTAKEQPSNTNKKDKKVYKVKKYKNAKKTESEDSDPSLLKIDNNSLKQYTPEIEKLYDQAIEFFPEDIRPKTEKHKSAWLDTLDKLVRIDGYSPEVIKEVIKKAREDPFWNSKSLEERIKEKLKG